MSLLDLSQLPNLPIAAFPQARTRSVDDLAAAAAREYGKLTFDVDTDSGTFHAVSNHARFSSVAITYATHGANVRIGIDQASFFAQLFSANGSALAKSGSNEIVISEYSSFICSADDKILLNYAPNFAQLVLRFEPHALVQKLELLTGRQIAQPLRFEAESNVMRPEAMAHRRLLTRLVEWTTTREPPNLALAELEQALLVSMLFANEHNYSHLLSSEPPKASPWQVKRAEAYIERNWAEPLTLETIAEACGTSVRSLFHTFRVSRGYGPSEFLRRVRLQRAYAMLNDPTAEMRVTDVAIACGFANAGHFARYYRKNYGELPSDTLNRGRAKRL